MPYKDRRRQLAAQRRCYRKHRERYLEQAKRRRLAKDPDASARNEIRTSMGAARFGPIPKYTPDDVDGAERVQLNRSMRKYGLTADDYLGMLARQLGRCLICGRPPKKRRLHVDHNHKTGRIRGLLCWQCNVKVIGALERYHKRIPRALMYLDGKLTEPPTEIL